MTYHDNPAMPCSDINELLPTVQRAAGEFLKRAAAAGLKVRITETFRSWAYQDKLYAQGRTTSGSIVTNAKGGQSNHNLRIAFDICQNISGKAYDESKVFTLNGKQVDFFLYCASIWKEMGGEWGGDWTGSLVDRCHFEYTGMMDWERKPGSMTVCVDDIVTYRVESFLINNKNYPNLREYNKILGIETGYLPDSNVVTIKT